MGIKAALGALLRPTLGSPGPAIGAGCVEVVRTMLPTEFGSFELRGYREPATGVDHVVLTMGEIADGRPVLVRVHSECLTGEALGSLRCDCGDQLDGARREIGLRGRGVVIYLRGHEGRGIGLLDKLRAYALQDEGADTVSANALLGLPVDCRDYASAVTVLRDLGVVSVELMTNNPDKVSALIEAGITIDKVVPTLPKLSSHNRDYLRTKQHVLGHTIPFECIP